MLHDDIFKIIVENVNSTLQWEGLTLLGWWRGAESARTFFKHPFFYEEMGSEVPNFLTFHTSLLTPSKSKNKGVG